MASFATSKDSSPDFNQGTQQKGYALDANQLLNGINSAIDLCHQQPTLPSVMSSLTEAQLSITKMTNLREVNDSKTQAAVLRKVRRSSLNTDESAMIDHMLNDYKTSREVMNNLASKLSQIEANAEGRAVGIKPDGIVDGSVSSLG